MTQENAREPDGLDCVVLRCSRQAEMYLYLRADLPQADLPQALLDRVGRLSEVMRLRLDGERRLARVDVQRVMSALAAQGFFLQLPPAGQVQAPLYAGD